VLTESAERAGVPVWREALASHGRPPAWGGELDADVAVIGGGLTGLSAAYHVLAAHPAARVVVLEAESVGHGASSRSTGMLTPGVGQDLAALVRRWGADTARAMYRRSLDAVEYVHTLTAREEIDVGLRMTGQLIVAHGRSSRRRLARQAAVLEALGLPCERLDDCNLRRHLRIAADAPGGAATGPAALRLPVAGTLHPGRLLHGLGRAVRRLGGTIVHGANVATLSRTAPVCATLADGRRLTARHVVVATSGYSVGLNPQRGRLVPLHLRVLLTERLTPAQLADLHWPGREGVIDSRRLFNYVRLTDDDRLLFGGGRPRYLWGGNVTDRPAEGRDLDRLVRQLRRFFPALRDLPIARSWTGVIAYSRDTVPVIGPVPGYERVLFAGGWCGHGIALSILSGRWVRHLIDTGRPPEPLPWFRQRAPLAPPEPLRWLAVRTGSRVMEMMDRV
jgi:glycine/D-amino acid oxidase-like deaminating enzyme